MLINYHFFSIYKYLQNLEIIYKIVRSLERCQRLLSKNYPVIPRRSLKEQATILIHHFRCEWERWISLRDHLASRLSITLRCTNRETRRPRDNKKKTVTFVSQMSIGQVSVKATVLIVSVEKRCLVCTGKWIKSRFPSLGKRGSCKLRSETRNNSVENVTF